MNFLKKLLKNNTAHELRDLTDGYCPNCWGDQEYADEVRVKFKDPQIDVNNHKANYAFIQEFMVTHLNGIKLKSLEGGRACPRCSAKG